MKSLPRLLALAALSLLFSCSPGQRDDPPDDPDPPPAASRVIDHRCTDLGRVPASWITAARDRLRVGYGHTSHGSQPVSGMQTLAGASATFGFTYSDWGLQPGVFLNDYWGNDGGADDLGGYGDLAWRDATVAMLSRPGNDRNVAAWSWCGGVSDTDASGIDAYLQAMAALERDYPGVTFVYMTGHLDGSGAQGNLNRRNEQIRAFCRDNGKFLFDFADIESYAPGGGSDYMALMADDNCDYDSDGDGSRDRNWAADWLAANPGSELARLAGDCPECAHSQGLNCVLKGRAFWWLLARIAGWDGN